MKPITLSTPIKRSDKTISEVTVRQPKGGELRGVSLSDLSEMQVDAVLKLIPRITTPAITEDEGEDLSAIDLMKIGAAIIGGGEAAGNGTTPKP